jgi:methylamine dehydrogenase accessory protein MauD
VHGWWAASYLVLWVLVLVLALVVVSLARQLGALNIRLGSPGLRTSDDEGPRLGDAPDAATLTDIHGASVTVGGPGRPRVLLFVSPGCGICEQLLPALPAIAKNSQVEPLVLTDANRAEAEREFGGLGLTAPLLSAPELLHRYNVPGTPYAVTTDRLGIVRAKGTVGSLDQLERLAESGRGGA